MTEQAESVVFEARQLEVTHCSFDNARLIRVSKWQVMGSMVGTKIDSRIHFPHSNVDIVMGGGLWEHSQHTFQQTVIFRNDFVLDMDASSGRTHPLSTFKRGYDNGWETFQHILQHT